MGQSLWRYLTFLFVSPHFITQSRRTVWDRRRDECQRPKPEMTFLTPCCWLYYTHLSVKLYSKWQHGPAGEKTDQMLFVAYIQLDSQNPSVPRRNVEFKSVTVLYIYIYILITAAYWLRCIHITTTSVAQIQRQTLIARHPPSLLTVPIIKAEQASRKCIYDFCHWCEACPNNSIRHWRNKYNSTDWNSFFMKTRSLEMNKSFLI